MGLYVDFINVHCCNILYNLCSKPCGCVSFSGSKDADEVLKILLGNPNMFGGVLACILDNTVPGNVQYDHSHL